MGGPEYDSEYEQEIAERSYANSMRAWEQSGGWQSPSTPAYEDMQTWSDHQIDQYYAAGGQEP